MPDVGFVNGRFSPLRDAAVPVEDRGFQFGDGVYEVIRTYRGVPFQVEAHLRRLERSAAALALTFPVSVSNWRAYIAEGLRIADYPECKIYIQLTRGPAPRDHGFPHQVSPTVVMTIRELRPLEDAWYASGVRAITLKDLRWGRCDIKSLNLLPNVLAKQQAREAGGFEALFIRRGRVTEGAASNIFLVSRETISTPGEGAFLLSGVTRKLVIELARGKGLTVNERSVRAPELFQADELFITGTTIGVMAITELDGRRIGEGRPGSLTAWLGESFLKAVESGGPCAG